MQHSRSANCLLQRDLPLEIQHACIIVASLQHALHSKAKRLKCDFHLEVQSLVMLCFHSFSPLVFLCICTFDFINAKTDVALVKIFQRETPQILDSNQRPSFCSIEK